MIEPRARNLSRFRKYFSSFVPVAAFHLVQIVTIKCENLGFNKFAKLSNSHIFENKILKSKFAVLPNCENSDGCKMAIRKACLQTGLFTSLDCDVDKPNSHIFRNLRFSWERTSFSQTGEFLGLDGNEEQLAFQKCDHVFFYYNLGPVETQQVCTGVSENFSAY